MSGLFLYISIIVIYTVVREISPS